MNSLNPIDFETFYFFSLLDLIKKSGKNKLDNSMQKNLDQFVDFLEIGETPIDSIERIARFQGTSDISIFFSDLIERIGDYTPEVALNKMSGYANDFLEIFNELAQEPHWKSTIVPEITGTSVEEGLILLDFTSSYLNEKLIEYSNDKDSVLKQNIEKFVERISSAGNLQQFLTENNNIEELKKVNNLISELYFPQLDNLSVESFINNFYKKIDSLLNELNQLFENNLDVFVNLCTGTTIVKEPEFEYPIEEEESIFETVQSEDKLEVTSPETKEDDIKLKLLLQDYITHEIDELASEVSQNLEKLKNDPQDNNVQKSVLDSIKVIKDLGQIHRYPAIEVSSRKVLENLDSFFKEKKVLSSISIATLNELLNEYNNYIDLFLKGKEEEGNESIEKMNIIFLDTIAPPPKVEEKYSMKEGNEVQDFFTDVNKRFIKQISENYHHYLETKDIDEFVNATINQIDHLKEWYEVWSLTSSVPIMEIIQNWLNEPKKHDRFEKKQNEIFEVFEIISERLFITQPDEWVSLLEKLTKIDVGEDKFKVSESIEAYKDVTIRELNLIKSALSDSKKSLLDTLNVEYSINFQQISQNSSLHKIPEVEKLSNCFLNQLPSLKGIPSKKQDEFQKGFVKLLDECIEFVSNLPEVFPVEKIKNQFGKLLAKLDVKINESLTAEREVGKLEAEEKETLIDDELIETFKNESGKYLGEIEKHTDMLKEDLNNTEELEQLSSSIHTIMGSAKMMKQTDIADLAAQIENLTTLILQQKLAIKKPFLNLCKRVVKAIYKQLEGKKVDINKLNKSASNYISKYSLDSMPKEDQENIEETSQGPFNINQENEDLLVSKTERLVEEKSQEGLLKLSERDPELLDIFKNEAIDKLSSIENDLTLIEKFKHDRQTLQSLDHSVHEIRSAAKMLGFVEIGILVDDLEELFEIIDRKEPEDWNKIIPDLRKVIHVIRELTEKYQVSQSLYDDAKTTTSSLLLTIGEDKGDKITPDIPRTTEKEQAKVKQTKQVIQTFIQEAREYIEDINFILMKIEKNPNDSELIDRLMRTLHTLKGSASMVNLEVVTKLTHLSEDLLERFKQESKGLPPQVFDIFFEVVDEIDFIIASLMDGNQPKVKSYDKIIKNIEDFYLKHFDITVSTDVKIEKGVLFDISEKKLDKTESTVEKKEGDDKLKRQDTFIRLHVDQMDNLLNETAELVINHTQFKTQLDKFKNVLPRLDVEGKNLQDTIWHLETAIKEQEKIIEQINAISNKDTSIQKSHQDHFHKVNKAAESLQKFHNIFQQMLHSIKASGKLYEDQVHKITTLSTQIYEQIIQARMVPVDMLFQRFQRPIRDLAKKYEKKVKIEFEGEGVELDRALVEELYEPILHILRNAVSHGIEEPEERKRLNKDEEGLVKISARQERNIINISIEDDGSGINLEKVTSRILELGLLEKDQIDKLTEQEIFEYMTYPGFSTAGEKSELSGRGIGLDVVKNQVQKNKGDLRIYSSPEKGARFVIRVPVSLTVTQAMLVDVNSHIYAVPLFLVEETINVDKNNVQYENDIPHLSLRGTKVPIVIMSKLLQIPGITVDENLKEKGNSLIIVKDEGIQVALLVDKILHREEILIKSLGLGLQGVRYLTGGSILADGTVVLVLDVPQIVFSGLRNVESNIFSQSISQTGKTDKSTGEEKPVKVHSLRKRVIEKGKPLVLVADDSLSIRKFLSGLLSKHGYEVETAKDGHKALEILNHKDFDLIITDLEMPQLSGYELIEQVRTESRWDNLPIIVLTGRASRHIQQQSLKLGADEFIIKPFKETDLLEKINKFITIKS